MRFATPHNSRTAGEALRLDDQRTQLGMLGEVAAGVRARRPHLQAFRPRVREDRRREPGGDATTAQSGRGPRMLHVEDGSAPLVLELGFVTLNANDEAA